jgi:hypothetical protein
MRPLCSNKKIFFRFNNFFNHISVNIGEKSSFFYCIHKGKLKKTKLFQYLALSRKIRPQIGHRFVRPLNFFKSAPFEFCGQNFDQLASLMAGSFSLAFPPGRQSCFRIKRIVCHTKTTFYIVLNFINHSSFF